MSELLRSKNARDPSAIPVINYSSPSVKYSLLILTDNSRFTVEAFPTNEEATIARHMRRLSAKQPPAAGPEARP